MTTTRERLIEAASNIADVGEYGIVDNWPEIIDAILDTLREPDEGMIEAASNVRALECGSCHKDQESTLGFVAGDAIAPAIAAAIDHIRSGK